MWQLDKFKDYSIILFQEQPRNYEIAKFFFRKTFHQLNDKKICHIEVEKWHPKIKVALKLTESLSWELIFSFGFDNFPKNFTEASKSKKYVAIVCAYTFDLFYSLDSLINHINRSLHEHHIKKQILWFFRDKLEWSNEWSLREDWFRVC